ncbi:MAG: phosphatase [Deltaproteobacteria bacterium CG_4_10_14_3_um_filter_60_8]|nr:MAG: phosphatase [Deltaproteobacteria bacterium CG_4_10_14_3_um_filter_60_8]
MIHFDLHIHSAFSDGALFPGDLVAKARCLELTTIALTDHDTMAGVPEAMAQGALQGITVLPGIEISAWHDNRAVHILGYGLRSDYPPLQRGLQTIQQARHTRNLAMLDKLQALGLPVTHAELAGLAHGQVGRPHIARLLRQKGVVRSHEEAFARFLVKGAKAYVARQQFPTLAAIRLIREAGGLAILAHPASLDPSLNALPAILPALQAEGLAGLEAFYPSHTPRMGSRLVELARLHGLLVSGGTDFHERPTWEELLARMKIPFSNPDEFVYWTQQLPLPASGVQESAGNN